MGPDAIINPQGGDFIPSLICFPLSELIRPPLAIAVRRELYHLCHLLNSYSLEEGNGYPSQYSWLENSRDRRAWRTTVHGVARVKEDWVTSTFAFHTIEQGHQPRDHRGGPGHPGGGERQAGWWQLACVYSSPWLQPKLRLLSDQQRQNSMLESPRNYPPQQIPGAKRLGTTALEYRQQSVTFASGWAL